MSNTYTTFKQHITAISDNVFRFAFLASISPFHHLTVLEIVDDVTDDITIIGQPQGLEYNHYWDIDTDVRQGSLDLMPINRISAASSVHLQKHR